MKEALYIIFGWLLGLLSQPIASRIEKYSRRKDLKTAIDSELKNIAVRLAATCYKIQMHLGVRNKTTLRWVKSIYDRYRSDCHSVLLETIDKLLESSDEQYDAAAVLFKAPENEGLGLKTFSLPFTESILEDLSVFDSKFQRAILEVRDKITLLNEDIEDAIFYFRLTFDPSSMNTNGGAIRANLKNCYNNIQERGKVLVDNIDNILKE